MDLYTLYQGKTKLLTYKAESKEDAANYFRKYLIEKLGKTGLYGYDY